MQTNRFQKRVTKKTCALNLYRSKYASHISSSVEYVFNLEEVKKKPSLVSNAPHLLKNHKNRAYVPHLSIRK